MAINLIKDKQTNYWLIFALIAAIITLAVVSINCLSDKVDPNQPSIKLTITQNGNTTIYTFDSVEKLNQELTKQQQDIQIYDSTKK